MSEYYMTKDELYHHGIKGQKWGIRNYQNADGSLTAAGREHYGYGEARNKMLSAKANYKQAQKAYSKSFNKASGASQYIRGLTKKGQAENERRYQDVVKTAKAAEKARSEYKQAKKELGEARKEKALETVNKVKATLSDPKVQKAIKIGAVVAGTALAAYGGYKLAKYLGDKKTQRAIKTAKSMLSTSKFMGTLAEKYAGIAENYGTEAKSKPGLGNYYNNGGKYTGIFRTTTPSGRDYSAKKTEYNPDKYRKYINKYETYRERANQYGDAGRSLMDIATGSNFRVSNSDPYALNARYVKLKK